MAHLLDDLAGEVSEYDWPAVACPTCRMGAIPFADITTIEDPKSASWHHHESWDPDMVYGTFVATPRCTNPACGQVLIITGTYRVVINDGEPEFGQYGELYKIRTIDPPLAIIDVPQESPQTVKDAVAAADRTVWLDPSSSANRLRTAVERMLDDRKVSKTRLTKKGARVPMPTHARIEEFGKKNKMASDAMMAVKWIGNSGAHDNELTARDVLDGATVLQLALKEVYDTTAKNTLKLVKAINRAKKIPRKKP